MIKWDQIPGEEASARYYYYFFFEYFFFFRWGNDYYVMNFCWVRMFIFLFYLSSFLREYVCVCVCVCKINK